MSRAWEPATSRSSTKRVAFGESSFCRNGYCRLRVEPPDAAFRHGEAHPIIGDRLTVDGTDAVRVIFQSRARGAAGYVILNTVTDRAREHLDEFRMDIGAQRGGRATLACVLPADAIMSYQFAWAEPRPVDPQGVTDARAWVAFVEEARPDPSNPLRIVNGRGHRASLFVGPDASVVWPSVPRPDGMRARREENIGACIGARLGGSLSRPVIVHDGETEARRTLLLLDGHIWRANGVGWLTRRYPGLRIVTIDAGEGVQREAEMTDTARVHALVWAVCDEAGVGPVMAAGQSYGGLAVLDAALRTDVPLDCALSQSPSLWWGGTERGRGEGMLMAGLRAGSIVPRGGVRLRLQVGTLERTMRPVVDDCGRIVRSYGGPVDVDHYRSGHDVAWWREGLVKALDDWCDPADM